MQYTYHITYSCYDHAMNILLNGTRVSSSSSLLQYMNEPFYKWCEILPEILAREVGEDFALIYTGRPEEAEILRTQAMKIKGCQGVSYREPILKDSLQMRMKKLNKLITDYRIPIHQRHIKAVFLGEKDILSKYRDEIESLEIENQFCKVDIRMMEIWNSGQLSKEDFPIYLSKTVDDAMLLAEDTDAYKYAMFLGEGRKDEFCKVKRNRFVFSFTEDALLEQLFQCFLLFPLLDCFNECITSIRNMNMDQNVKRNLLVLKAIKPLVQVRAESQIELECSVPLEMRCLPSGASKPELEFQYQIPGIVQCSQNRVTGIKAGRTEVKVYEKGSIDAIRTLTFEVYMRNRITDIVLTENHMVCGEGDCFTIGMDYYPEDADNADTIQWRSSHPDIAKVDKNGRVFISGIGRCKITCTAEKIISECKLDCKPYLKEIRLPEDIQGELLMKKGEVRVISCVLNPTDAIDKELIISSSDLLTVNVVGNELEAIADGTAIISVENKSHSIRHDFKVIVGNTKKKKGLFGLFG